MIDCQSAQLDLLAMLRGELPARKLAALTAHVDSCAECSAELKSLREYEAVIRSVDITPDSGFVGQVMAAVAVAEPEELSPRDAINFRRRTIIFSVSVASHAAVLLLCAGLVHVRADPEPTVGYRVALLERVEREMLPVRAGDGVHDDLPALGEEQEGHLGLRSTMERYLSEDEDPGRDEFEDEPELADGSSGRKVGAGGMIDEPSKFEPMPSLATHDRPGQDPQLFAARLSPDSRMARVRSYLTVASTRSLSNAIEGGLRYLARSQERDGSWDPRVGGGREELRVAVTALSVLPFLAEGHSSVGKDDLSRNVVAPAIAYLESQLQRDGSIGLVGERPMFNHGIATLALAENLALVAGGDSPKAIRDHGRMASRATRFLRLTQITRRVDSSRESGMGGWGYRSNSAITDTNVTAWQVQALHAFEGALSRIGRRASTQVDGSFAGVQTWLSDYTDPLSSKVGYNGFRQYGEYGPVTLTAIGLTCSVLSGSDPSGQLLVAQQRYIAANGSTFAVSDTAEPDYTRGYFSTLSLFLQDPDSAAFRDSYRKAVTDLVPLQEEPEDAASTGIAIDGSWPPICRWSGFGGRAYTTSMSLLVLQTPYRMNR